MRWSISVTVGPMLAIEVVSAVRVRAAEAAALGLAQA
jgi:hypothetical protein